MKLVAVVQLAVENSWIGLDRRKRATHRRELNTLIAGHPEVNCRWFDSEAWSGGCSEMIVCQFGELKSYHKLWADLREHPFLAHPYARIARVSMGIERKIQEEDIRASRG